MGGCISCVEYAKIMEWAARVEGRIHIAGFTLLRAGNGYVVLKDADKLTRR